MRATLHVLVLLVATRPGLARDATPAPADPPSDAVGVEAPSAEPDDGRGPVDWSKVPPIQPIPRAGWFTIKPSGPGYYTLLDRLRGDLRADAPPAPFGTTGSNQTPFYDRDFRYLDDPGNDYHLWSDCYKRVHPGEDWLFSTGGELRYRYEDYRSRSFSGANDHPHLTRVRTYADLWYRDDVRLFAELIDARAYYYQLPPFASDATGSDLLNAFAEVKMAELAGSPVMLRGGRQEIVLGSERLIASPDWSNTLRTYDGVRGYWHTPKWSVDAFWARPVTPAPNRFDSANRNSAISGAIATYRPTPHTLIDLYLYNLSTATPASRGTINTYGARFAGDVRKRLLYDFEAMAQTGDRAGRAVAARAATAGLGWHFADLPGNVSFWTYFDYASGSPDPSPDAEYRTFNQLFPAGHTYFGYLDLIGRQNIQDLNFQLESNPEPWLQLRAQYHIFRLSAARDALYDFEGTPLRRDPTGRAGSNIGSELDLLTNVHVTPRQDLLLGFSQLYSGRFIRETGPRLNPQFFYVQYTFRW